MIRASENIMLVIVCLYFAAHSGYEQDMRTKQLYMSYEFMHIHSYKRLILHATMHAYACLCMLRKSGNIFSFHGFDSQYAELYVLYARTERDIL